MARYGVGFSPNTTTGPDDFIPSVIIPEVQETAARVEVFRPLFRNIDVTGPGDSYTVPQSAALAWAQLGSNTYIDGTSPNEVVYSTTARTFTPIFYSLDVLVPMDVIAGAAPGISPQDEIIKEVGTGLALHRDGLAAALYTEAPSTTPDHEIGTDAVALSYSDITAATKLLYTQNAPRPFSWVIHPTQWGELMADNTVIDAATAGQPGLTLQQGANGYIAQVFDAKIYVSDQIDESSGLHSMFFSTGRAFGYVYKRLQSPLTGMASEVMLDIDWNSARRTYEVNSTYQCAVGGMVKTSTTNNWVVDLIS